MRESKIFEFIIFVPAFWASWISGKTIISHLPYPPKELYTSISTLAQMLVLTLLNNEFGVEFRIFNINSLSRRVKTNV